MFWLNLIPAFFVILLVDGICFEFRHGVKFFRWLKGSQKNYHLQNGYLNCSEGKPWMRIFGVSSWRHPTIEIRRGLFRGSSQIFELPDRHWAIARDWFIDGDWISLKDTQGLPIKTALKMMERHRSLQEMVRELEQNQMELKLLRGLNEEFRTRCAEQQKQIDRLGADLEIINYQRVQAMGVIYAVQRVMENDRSNSRFRSKFSAALRTFLADATNELVKKNSRVPKVGHDAIRRWEADLVQRLMPAPGEYPTPKRRS